MQLINSATLGLLLSALPSALAGIVVIGSPSEGTNVTAGSTIPVDIQKYVRLPTYCLHLLKHPTITILNPLFLPPRVTVTQSVLLSHDYQQTTQPPSKDVSVLFSINPCTNDGVSCPDTVVDFGWIIYGAPYDPQLSTPNSTIANQTYQLAIPERYKGEMVVLSVAHVVLDGVSDLSFLPFGRLYWD